MAFENLRGWLGGGGTKAREFRQMRESWESTERLWRASPFARRPTYEFAIDFMKEAMDEAERLPASGITVAFSNAIDDILYLEDITEIEANWRAIEDDAAIAMGFRQMVARRRRWCLDFDRMIGLYRAQVLDLYRAYFAALPESCFGYIEEGAETFEVPLIELLDDPVTFIEALIRFAYSAELEKTEILLSYRTHVFRNILVASGFPPTADPSEHADHVKGPRVQRGKTPRELAAMYLGGTPFEKFLEFPVPFHIPDEGRFEHCHIVGGTGHGKTQLMQRMIHADLVKATRARRSVVVVDSQGDLINKLVRLELFDPDTKGSLADRLVVIDPADVEFPAALNLFDAHLDRIRGYRPVDRERALNGVIELYEGFFGAMLGAELTQKQGVIFRYLAHLMLSIPGATIHTLMQLMEDGKPFKRYMDELEGSARYFFQTEFFHPSFAATKKQILRRLWGVLSTPAFERMFAQEANKLDLFEAMNEGKIIFISTAKDLLKAEGSAIFGRFFIALVAQSAQERSMMDARERTPTFVYIDEAQEYFDESIETILNQARKYRVGLTLAHQTLDQLSPRLRGVLNANTSMKCVGGVSAKDARALAEELRTSSDFIEGMRRRANRTEFAVWLKQMTPQAIRLTVPLGFLERQPLLSEEAFGAVLENNRERYCGTLADVLGFELPDRQAAEERPPPRKSEPQSPGDVGEPDTPQSRDTQRGAIPRPEPKSKETAHEALRPPERPAARELGKGGSQHRYVQHLVKGLAEERGFRAVIEEAVDGGQIDVALYRDALRVAVEISVTSKPEYEAQNLAKCLRSGFGRVFAIAADQKRLRAIEAQVRERLTEDDLTRIDFLTPELVASAIEGLAPPPEEPTVVRGYRVKVSRTRVSQAEAQDRRSTVARVIAQSMRNLPNDP